MAEKDQIRKDEEKAQQTPEVTELDDQSLDDVSGGIAELEREAATNGNCLC